jgi:hypothetical protein
VGQKSKEKHIIADNVMCVFKDMITIAHGLPSVSAKETYTDSIFL